MMYFNLMETVVSRRWSYPKKCGGRWMVIAVLALLPTTLCAEDLWVANRSEFPGRLRRSDGGTQPQLVLTRADRANPAYPGAEMKVANIAISADQQVYYCSGLDGSVMQLLDGRHEIRPFEFRGQIRDLACNDKPHSVYFSVVATPLDGQALADGEIYVRDLHEGSPQLVAKIPQDQVGGNWWGQFTIRGDDIFLVTTDRPSRIFRWSAGSATEVFAENRQVITGITVGPEGEFIFADGSGSIQSTTDFKSFQAVLNCDLKITEVAHRALDRQ